MNIKDQEEDFTLWINHILRCLHTRIYSDNKGCHHQEPRQSKQHFFFSTHFSESELEYPISIIALAPFHPIHKQFVVPFASLFKINIDQLDSLSLGDELVIYLDMHRL